MNFLLYLLIMRLPLEATITSLVGILLVSESIALLQKFLYQTPLMKLILGARHFVLIMPLSTQNIFCFYWCGSMLYRFTITDSPAETL